MKSDFLNNIWERVSGAMSKAADTLIAPGALVEAQDEYDCALRGEIKFQGVTVTTFDTQSDEGQEMIRNAKTRFERAQIIYDKTFPERAKPVAENDSTLG